MNTEEPAGLVEQHSAKDDQAGHLDDSAQLVQQNKALKHKIQELLQKLQSNTDTGSLSEGDFDCSICAQLLCDPITLPECGHSFCRHVGVYFRYLLIPSF